MLTSRKDHNPLPQAQLGGEGRVRGALGFSIQGEDQKRPLTPTLSPDDEAVRGEGDLFALRWNKHPLSQAPLGEGRNESFLPQAPLGEGRNENSLPQAQLGGEGGVVAC